MEYVCVVAVERYVCAGEGIGGGVISHPCPSTGIGRREGSDECVLIDVG